MDPTSPPRKLNPINRLLSSALAVSFALAPPPGSPDWRDLNGPVAPQEPNASTGASSPSGQYAEPAELDEGKF